MAKEAEAEEEAKGVAGTILKTVSVVDIFLGAIALYALWSLAPQTLASIKGTGLEFADNALLVCAAAITGKVINLAASAIMAIWRPGSTFTEALTPALEKHEGKVTSSMQPEARAFAHLGRAAKDHYIRLCDEATLCYGTTLLLITVAVIFGVGARLVLGIVLGVVGAVLVLVARVRHNESVEFLTAELAAAVPASARTNTGHPPPGDQTGELDGA